jgi:hypothetical protein
MSRRAPFGAALEHGRGQFGLCWHSRAAGRRQRMDVVKASQYPFQQRLGGVERGRAFPLIKGPPRGAGRVGHPQDRIDVPLKITQQPTEDSDGLIVGMPAVATGGQQKQHRLDGGQPIPREAPEDGLDLRTEGDCSPVNPYGDAASV